MGYHPRQNETYEIRSGSLNKADDWHLINCTGVCNLKSVDLQNQVIVVIGDMLPYLTNFVTDQGVSEWRLLLVSMKGRCSNFKLKFAGFKTPIVIDSGTSVTSLV